jgi:ATP-dependent DNA helicase RecG
MEGVASAKFDINRLQQALTVEVDNGFSNLQGKQFRFADFLQSNLKLEPETLGIADRYGEYDQYSQSQRQSLVAETRRVLYDLRRRELERFTPIAQSSSTQITKSKKPRTEKLTEKLIASKTPLSLTSSLTQLAGLGRLADKLIKLDLHDVQDVLHYYPRDHVDYARQVAIADLVDGNTVTVVGTIQKYSCFTSPKNPNLTIVEIQLRDRTGRIKLNRFWMGKRYANRGWQEQQRRLYPENSLAAASGVVKRGKFGLTLDGFELEILESSSDRIESETIGRVVPIYPLTEGISPEMIRKVVIQCLPLAQKIEDPLPVKLRKDYQLIDLADAIAAIHYPEDSEKLIRAIIRLTFDKFFYRRLVSLYRRNLQKGTSFMPQSKLIAQLEQMLPFTLTDAQKRVVAEIRADLQKTTPMNRLVQGDVGSGKTIVAVYSILAAIESGFQTALMAPTEVLSEQHYRKIMDWFTQLHLPVELLTGSTKASKRREILRQLETGELPLLIGTHALIQDGVNFQRLGLVVIDEQHRFGRDQRSRLLQKGEDPHVLIMTATPIPRTLYLTNSEIEVSIIDQLPPGRKPIQTNLLKPSQRKDAYDLIRREVAQGRQAYIVLPLVEESEKMEDVRAAIQEKEHLQTKIFPNFQIGLLHGQMNSAEKDLAIQEFRQQKSQVLVATTVIEVGVDIPNASVMLIEHSDRFGLAQLHQLRGRVGRGAAQSFCLLISNSKSETAIERLQVLEQSQDGFFIAERDFQIRGKGKDEGTEQSGHAGFAIEDRLSDEAIRQEIFQIARQAAERVMAKDPSLESFPALKSEFERHYQRLQGGVIFT